MVGCTTSKFSENHSDHLIHVDEIRNRDINEIQNRISCDVIISNLYGLSMVIGKYTPVNIQVFKLGGIWGKIHIVKQMTKKFRPNNFMLRALISPTIITLNSINTDHMSKIQLKVCNKLLNDIYSAWIWIYANEQ